MEVLVVGASGATGRLLVEQLLNRGSHVKAIVRSEVGLPERVSGHRNLSVIQASVLEIGDAEMARHVMGCNAVASCLGHTLSLGGVFGPPRRLVTDATRRLCAAVKANRPARPVKFVLMNTTGNRNRGLDEQVSFSEKCVIGLLRLILPPHVDNEEAAEFLRSGIGHADADIQWSVVRPDTLKNDGEVSDYSVHPSPTRSAIFNSGETSRINVASFMADLITDNGIWHEWKGAMPVIYNQDSGALRQSSV